jgi:hypothetical protein
MELLYFFLGAACAIIAGMLVYSVLALGEGGAKREHIVLEGDFELLTCTTELVLVPVTSRAEELLNQSPDTATAPYYRAIIVERERLPQFAEHCWAAGLTMAFQQRQS